CVVSITTSFRARPCAIAGKTFPDVPTLPSGTVKGERLQPFRVLSLPSLHQSLVLATSIGLLGQQIDDLNKPTAVSKAGCARLRVAGPLFWFWYLF
ncbi:hypothetical protein MJO29_016468, partial [Puccinia striiformis f. sp. tritici]